MEQSLHLADAWELADSVRAGEIKSVELLDLALERIGRHDGDLNSFVLVDPDGARDQADQIDQRVAAGEDPGPLAGIPIGVKDLEDAAGLPTGRGSLLFGDQVAERDSTQVARLRNAGVVVLGKTASPELGTLMYTWSKATGATHNPWNLDRTPGGSSGGSAAAVGAGLVALATGSDGGGSIRIPCAYSGLPGLKPTFGLVARGPGWLGSSNMSVCGPVARSVRDIARYLDQVTGVHSMDPFSLPKPDVTFEGSLGLPLKGLRAAWSADLGFGVCAREVEGITRSATERLIEEAQITEVDLPVELPDVFDSWVVAGAIDCYAEMETFWPARAEDLTPVVVMNLQIAESLSPDQMAEALRGRYEMMCAVNDALDQVDLIITPTTPTVAFGVEGPIPGEIDGETLKHPLLGVCFTFPFNLTGHPAVTVPAGFDSMGMPVGLQIVGPRLSEARLLSVARAFEQIAPWPKIAPSYA